MLKSIFALSDKGVHDLKKGILAAACTNLSLILPMALLFMLLGDFIDPFIGNNFSSPNLFFYTILSVLCIIIIFAVNFIEYRCTYISSYEESAVRRVGVAEKLRKLPLSFFGEHDLTELTTTMMNDCNELERTFSGAVPKLFGSILCIIIFLAALFVLDWRMALALFCVFPLAMTLILGSKKIQQKFGTKRLNSKLSAADGIQEYLETICDIKACNQTDLFLDELDSKLDNVVKQNIKIEILAGTLLTSAQMLLRLGLPLVVLVGANLLVTGNTNLFTYLIFLLASTRVYEPLSGVLAQLTEIFGAELKIKNVKKMNAQPELNGKIICNNHGYDITFEHVSFSYHDNEPVLDNISFTARQGQVTALVGPSGSGKSTAARLAARFWDANSGRILLGGVDISAIDPEILLKNYSIVFQDVVLFNDTIMENIRIGKLDASDHEVIEAAKAACCDEFISRLPDSYHTLIGENGSTLSGGERQRISIARALLKNAPIILLDEATASLDVENETLIQSAINTVTKGKTVLVIAHRMRTVAGSGHVIVLNKGKIVEDGTPSKLMEQNGLYHHLTELQKTSEKWSLS